MTYYLQREINWYYVDSFPSLVNAINSTNSNVLPSPICLQRSNPVLISGCKSTALFVFLVSQSCPVSGSASHFFAPQISKCAIPGNTSQYSDHGLPDTANWHFFFLKLQKAVANSAASPGWPPQISHHLRPPSLREPQFYAETPLQHSGKDPARSWPKR